MDEKSFDVIVRRYMISVLEYRRSKTRNTQKTLLFCKKQGVDIEEKIHFKKKSSVGSCTTFSENMVFKWFHGFEKFASKLLTDMQISKSLRKQLNQKGILRSSKPQNL